MICAVLGQKKKKKLSPPHFALQTFSQSFVERQKGTFDGVAISRRYGVTMLCLALYVRRKAFHINETIHEKIIELLKIPDDCS